MTDAGPLVLAANIARFDHAWENAVLPLLPEVESASIRKNRRAEDRCRRILARLLLAHGLRVLHGWELRQGLAAPRREPEGRPFVPGLDRGVSLSHSGRWAVCAVGGPGQARVGVDVEEIRPLPVEDFGIVFTAGELRAIQAHAVPHAELIRRWTIKEAVLKARGSGLLGDPLLVDTQGDGGSVQGEDFCWRHLHLDHDHWLTVAGTGPTGPTKLIFPELEWPCGPA